MSINHSKTVVMHFCTSGVLLSSQLSVGSHPLQVVLPTRLLGITVDDQLNLKHYVSNIIRAASYRIYKVCRLRSLVITASELKRVYTSFILLKLVYTSPAWSSSLSLTKQEKFESSEGMQGHTGPTIFKGIAMQYVRGASAGSMNFSIKNEASFKKSNPRY